MISQKDNPAEWALLMYELDDAKEALETLMREMTEDPEYEEANFRVDLGHIYSHLNRAWNSKDRLGTEWTQEKHEELSRFPKDIEPT
ncbi:MAG: hypothetical protein E6H76_14420 [Betaproteobacteria bacterium]|nr:MAG: hypothetical protein E6H76_14420 [Betaproteobacteria bacterium]